METELYAEPWIGWRVWNLGVAGRGRVVLRSAITGMGNWRAQWAYEARCARGEDHLAPDEECTCGVYASESMDWLFIEPNRPAVPVIGQVALWGRVVEHEEGWRAQHAYPSRLRLVCGRCLQEGHGLGTPSFAWRDGDHISTACFAHCGPEILDPDASRDPREVEAELLSAYAVDLLPQGALDDIFAFQSGRLATVPGLKRSTPPKRGRARGRLRGAVATLAKVALVGAMFIPGRVLGSDPAASVPEAASEAAASVPSPPGLEDSRPEIPAPEPLEDASPPARGKTPMFKAVCGSIHGTRITYVGCGRANADLFGFASKPPDPPRSCFLDAFTRRRFFSVCWLSSPGVDVVRRPTAPNPFRR